MLTRNFLTAALIVAGCAAPASASLTTYSTLSSFQAATTDDAFSNISFAQNDLYTTSTSDQGVDFSTSSTAMPYLIGENNIVGWPAGSALVSTGSTGGNTLTITLPSDVDAVSLYIGLALGGDQIQISVSDAGGGTPDSFSVQPSINLGSPYFIGLTTNTSFSTFTITSLNLADELAIGDMQIGQPQATPEVATFLLVGTGLLAMGYFRRRTIRRVTRRKPLRTVTA
jgi:hypothetical protein